MVIELIADESLLGSLKCGFDQQDMGFREVYLVHTKHKQRFHHHGRFTGERWGFHKMGVEDIGLWSLAMERHEMGMWYCNYMTSNKVFAVSMDFWVGG